LSKSVPKFEAAFPVFAAYGIPIRTIEAVAVAKTPSGEGGDGLGLGRFQVLDFRVQIEVQTRGLSDHI